MVAGEAGKALWFIPGVSNVLTGIGNSEGGSWEPSGAARAGCSTPGREPPRDSRAFTKGRLNPVSALLGPTRAR